MHIGVHLGYVLCGLMEIPPVKLNARQVDTAKPKDEPYKLSDGGGLYLLINPNGKRYWRLKYRVAGKEKLLALGVYPDVTLAEARSKREKAKRGIAVGIAPNVAKREEKLARCPHCRISLPRIYAEKSDAANQSETKGTGGNPCSRS